MPEDTLDIFPRRLKRLPPFYCLFFTMDVTQNFLFVLKRSTGPPLSGTLLDPFSLLCTRMSMEVPKRYLVTPISFLPFSISHPLLCLSCVLTLALRGGQEGLFLSPKIVFLTCRDFLEFVPPLFFNLLSLRLFNLRPSLSSRPVTSPPISLLDPSFITPVLGSVTVSSPTMVRAKMLSV